MYVGDKFLKKFSLLIGLLLLLPVSLWAGEKDSGSVRENVSVSGSIRYYIDDRGEKFDTQHPYRKDLIEKYRLKILGNNGEYLWGSNKNLKLIKAEKTLTNDNGEETTYTIFTNPEGEGMVIIRHEDYKKYKENLYLGDLEPNYVEYRLSNNGQMETFFGSTLGRFYPKPPVEWMHRPPFSINPRHSIDPVKALGFPQNIFYLFPFNLLRKD